MKTKDIVLTAMFTALISVGTFIRIPLPLCPLTLQPLFTALAGVVLGSKRGSAAAFGYLLLGLLGVPVFTGGGGFGYILKPTFGFILGFCVQAYITGRFAETGTPKLPRLIAGTLCGLLVMYAMGAVYYWLISEFYLGSFTGVWVMLLNCCLLPLPKDVLSCVLAAVLGVRLLPVVKRMEQSAAA